MCNLRTETAGIDLGSRCRQRVRTTMYRLRAVEPSKIHCESTQTFGPSHTALCLPYDRCIRSVAFSSIVGSESNGRSRSPVTSSPPLERGCARTPTFTRFSAQRRRAGQSERRVRFEIRRVALNRRAIPDGCYDFTEETFNERYVRCFKRRFNRRIDRVRFLKRRRNVRLNNYIRSFYRSLGKGDNCNDFIAEN